MPDEEPSMMDVLDEIVKGQVFPMDALTPTIVDRVVSKNMKCSHGNAMISKDYDLISNLPSGTFDSMFSSLKGNECFVEVYRADILRWRKDCLPCYGLCHTFVAREHAYWHDSHYYCETCYRKRML